MASQSSSVNLLLGSRIGAYRIERELGSGGMADVYYGIHEGLQRPAAIKVLRPSLASEATHLQRFMQEARAAASLVHPNIVQVYDVGQDGDHRYIAQEYIAGSNLRQYMSADTDATNQPAVTNSSSSGSTGAQDRQLGIAETLSMLLQILAALTKSSSSKIVHRDIKPENIMLTEDGEVKVADFGLARVLLGDDPQLTRAGTTLGTPMYMSPEQIQEGNVDIRSDLYSLGVTLYHMLGGQPPFSGETPLALAMKHVQTNVPPLTDLRRDLPSSLAELVDRLLSKKPADRFSDPAEVVAYLKQHRSGDLADVWPDQTVPLPGASHARSAGPLQATLELQSRLRNRASRGRSWLAPVLTTCLLLGSFAIGAASTFRRPFRIFEDGRTDIYQDVPHMASAEDQFQLALLDTTLDPVAKWEAVAYYFPDDGYYAGQSSIKLADALQERGDYKEAQDVLQRTLRDPEVDAICSALAHLQLAIGADEQGSDEELKSHVDAAIQLAGNEGFSQGDHRNLNELVRLMPSRISKRWFAAPSNNVSSRALPAGPVPTPASGTDSDSGFQRTPPASLSPAGQSESSDTTRLAPAGKAAVA